MIFSPCDTKQDQEIFALRKTLETKQESTYPTLLSTVEIAACGTAGSHQYCNRAEDNLEKV